MTTHKQTIGIGQYSHRLAHDLPRLDYVHSLEQLGTGIEVATLPSGNRTATPDTQTPKSFCERWCGIYDCSYE